jgi:hypothetical protein
MDTYTAIMSLGGIIGLVAFVAVLTFHEEIRKWARYQALKMRRKGNRSKLNGANSLSTGKVRNLEYDLFLEKEDSLFMKHPKQMSGLSKAALNETKGVA